MKKCLLYFSVLSMLLCGEGSLLAGQVHQVSFDSLMYHDHFGAKAGTEPLTPIFEEDSIIAMVDTFIVKSGKYYNYCMVDSAYQMGVGENLNMQINNINLGFDLTKLPALTSYLTMEFGDFGGSENLVVNGDFWEGELSQISFLKLGGCHVFIENIGEGYGIIRIIGKEIKSVFIGGQELWIDNLMAYEEIPEKLCVNFESQPIGTSYGQKTHLPGDIAFYENTVTVRIDSFYLKSGSAFNVASIMGASGEFGSGHVVNTNNINLSFSAKELPFVPVYASFEFINMGGFDNLIINGDRKIGSLQSMDGLEIGGAKVIVCYLETKSGVKGFVQIFGEINSLQVGGQELLLDNICFYKDAPYASCDDLVDFESLDPDTSFGTGTNSPGDFIFAESNVGVYVETFYTSPKDDFFNQADVQFAMPGIGICQTMWLNNINLLFKFGKLGYTVNRVSFEFAAYGGIENLQVNDGKLFIGNLVDAPFEIAEGVTCEVIITGIDRSRIIGIVILTGEISQFQVGGQELMIDNLCINGEMTALNDQSCGCSQPDRFILEQNYPNPFNPETTIGYYIPAAGKVEIEIYNAIGQVILSINRNHTSIGYQQLKFNAGQLASGVYFYKVKFGNVQKIRRMILIK